MNHLYVEALITWHGSPVPKGFKFASMSSQAIAVGRFMEMRTELHSEPISVSRQQSFDAIKRRTDYPNCSVKLNVITEDGYLLAVAARRESDAALAKWLGLEVVG